MPWTVDGSRLAQKLALKTVTIINDLEAIAYGVDVLEPKDLAVLNEGDRKPQAMRPSSPQVLVWARRGFSGTDLGIFLSHAKAAIPILPLPMTCSTRCFATCVHSLDTSVGSASFLGRACSTSTSFSVRPGSVTSRIGSDWKSSRETLRARSRDTGSRARARYAFRRLDLFVSLYGSEAGNLALKMMATGGVFLGGGIAPKIVDKLRSANFLQAFATKGRMSDLLNAIPIRVILNDKAGLLGAAHYTVLNVSD